MSSVQTKNIKPILKYTNTDFYYALVIFYVIFAFLAALLSSSFFGLRVFTNKSQSMNPTIDTGSIIVVKKFNEYDVGDIISYYAQNNGQEEIITHRIFRIGGNVYLTKGDANQATDEYKIVPRLIIGKVILIIPHLGYLIAFAKTGVGVWLLIIFPGALIIFIEVVKIFLLLKQP